MAARRFDSLPEWLDWQQTLHHSEIDLGLPRVRSVAQALFDLPTDYPVITVAGTNGKGSVSAYLHAMLAAAGFKTGVFTSPHLQAYNERIQIDGKPVSDEQLVAAFARIDAARAHTSLTYFEFSALAALLLFDEFVVDCAILEVGMGGRLDAINIVDADVAIITNVALDHVQWLGTDREQIGAEKAGIMRSGKAAICGDRDPPASLLKHARETGARLKCLGRDFDCIRDGETWIYQSADAFLGGLPLPGLAGAIQIDNAAVAVAALQELGERFPVAIGHLHKGLKEAFLPGRIQRVGQDPEWILDVSHNPAAARVLADWLAATRANGQTLLVFAMLEDKDAAGVARVLAGNVDAWFLGSLAGSRALSARDLQKRIATCTQDARVSLFDTVAAACEAARRDAGPNDRIVVCGSFHTVWEALAHGL